MSEKHKVISACKAKHPCYNCKFESICPDKVKTEHEYEMICPALNKSLLDMLEINEEAK